MRSLASGVLFCALTLFGCSSGAPPRPPTSVEASARQKIAMAMFAERCQKAGEFIRRTVEDVDGIVLLKIRPPGTNYGDQFALTDPFGHDFGGDTYIRSFLRGHYQQGLTGGPSPNAPPAVMGYEYVDLVDPADGIRYRYTGHIEEPWQTNKSYSKGYTRFVAQRVPAVTQAPRYGVTYDDISTREEREYWIAGSSLTVVDLSTGEVIAERIGYTVDRSQGSQAGSRSPWLWALDNACPSLLESPGKASGPAFSAATYRTARFVEKVLKPRIK